MQRKQWFLLAVALVLTVVYVWHFTGWFRHKEIRISSTSRASLARFHVAGMSATVAFALDGAYTLTEVKVVPLAAWQTNLGAPPLWHLVSDSNSAPVNVFSYGQRIRGMKPAVSGERPQPLETNVAYRLFVIAVKIKGQHDFEIGGSLPGLK